MKNVSRWYASVNDAIKVPNEKDRISSLIIENMVSSCEDSMNLAALMMTKTIQNGKKIMWCGNGGSAAQAQHLSAELVGGLKNKKKEPIPSISLTTDSSFLTAWTNDTDFDTVFSRQISALGKEGDILIGLTTSGNSENIIKAIELANLMKINTIALTGKDQGKIRGKGNITIAIPSNNTQRIQEGHILCGHILCELVENSN